jgi:hypothetical protein
MAEQIYSQRQYRTPNMYKKELSKHYTSFETKKLDLVYSRLCCKKWVLYFKTKYIYIDDM